MARLLIFDCDGTLIDSEVLAARVYLGAWAEHGVSLSEEDFYRYFVGAGPDDPYVRAFRARLPHGAAEAAEERFLAEMPASLTAVAGVPEMLPRLAGPLAVASNSSALYLQRALSCVGLASYFANRVFSAREGGRPKPAPDVFLRAAASVGAAPADCLVVEDSAAGMSAARAAGMSVLAFLGGRHFASNVMRERALTVPADAVCESISELEHELRARGWL